MGCTGGEIPRGGREAGSSDRLNYLLQTTADPSLWQMMRTWTSREAFEQMRASEVPPGILIYRAAGAEPVLALFDVVAEGELHP